MKQLYEKEVFEGITTLPNNSVPIPCSYFVKEKLDANGQVIKLKGRVVAGGHKQVRDGATETSSPTVAITSVFIIAALAARNRWFVQTLDITGAYLNAELHEEVYMKLDPFLGDILCEISPGFNVYSNADGTIYVRLKRALYGLIQSSRLWYLKLKNSLLEFGFNVNMNDQCVFQYKDEVNEMLICVYVDDILVTSNNQETIQKLDLFLQKKFQSITMNNGNIHCYLGMNFTLTNLVR